MTSSSTPGIVANSCCTPSIFTDEMASATADSDVFVIESNHDTDMLLGGPYPPVLKQRILSEHGHLSNKAAARAVLDVHALENKPRCILLAHLSQENNTREKAVEAVSRAMPQIGHVLSVAPRCTPGERLSIT